MKLRLVLLALLAASTAHAADGFEAVRCNGDVRGALLGKKLSDEPVVQIEKRHADLSLKDLGGDEITDDLNSTSWRICGKEYVVVSGRHGTVLDVLAFPAHSKTAPEFAATMDCQANGKAMPGTIFGVLDNRSGKADALLPATAAWKIDTKTGKIAPVPTAGLVCPRDAIITEDGGK